MSDEQTPGESNEFSETKEDLAQVDPQNLIADANAAAERLEAANKESARLISLQQAEKVEQTLSGTTTAGVPTISEEDRATAAAKKFLAGTGFDEELFPTKNA